MPSSETAAIVALASAVSAALTVTRLSEALNADEAYLWYGVQRVLEGRLPHRDFRSYEPGRYVFCAALASVLGGGLRTIRIATHLFYAVGLAAALVALRRVGVDWPGLVLGAVLLAAWALPMHKLYEPALLMWSFFAAVALLLHPSNATAFGAGVVAGAALFFGFNYFLYLGGSLAVLWVSANFARVGLSWALAPWAVLGVLVGALPFLGLACVPGFAAAFYERRVRAVVARGSSNLPLPVPWPWRPPPDQLAGVRRLRQVAFQSLFMLLPLAPWTTLVAFAAFGANTAPWLGAVAAATGGTVGWHHAFSRADPQHLAQSMAPLCLLAVVALDAATGFGLPLLAALTAASLALTWPMQPSATRRAAPQEFVWVRTADGSALWMPKGEGDLVARAAELCSREPGGGTFVALPALLMLYPILGRRAPIYDIFSVFPAEPWEEERMIAAIRDGDVRLAFISDARLDGRESLRFSATHPRVWKYLHTHMELLTEPGLPPHIRVFRAGRAISEPEASSRRERRPCYHGRK